MDIKDPVINLPGVGTKLAQNLEKLQIKTIEDLLWHIPSRYVSFKKQQKIRDLKIGENISIMAQVTFIKNAYTKSKKQIQLGTITDGEKELSIIWFNQPYITRIIRNGDFVVFSGKVTFWNKKLAMFSPLYKKTTGTSEIENDEVVVPIYKETQGITSKWITKLQKEALKIVDLNQDFSETLQSEDKTKYELTDLQSAIQKIHLPLSGQEAIKARKRLAFDELLVHQIANEKKRILRSNQTVTKKLEINNADLENFIKDLPFELTKSQVRTIEEIVADLKKEIPMNRLLEGDVGSGKTVIATLAAYIAFINKSKTAIMAPTQILAQQHYITLSTLLKKHNIKIDLILSGTKITTDSDIYIGTHALLHQKETIENLTLVVIDEQHKFGVKQRANLVGKTSPHVLTMTATPIPRTIALTLFGDLDLSTLDELPKGRQKIVTWLIPKKKREKAYKWIDEQIEKEKNQIFVVCPLIEESEVESLKDVKSAKLEFEKLKKVFPKRHLALLHGRQKAKEKQEILNDFKNGLFDILVTTPVVEVGIDIPNATIIVIEAADRFGLAQLHQLRGRVGRGLKKSYCLLMTENLGAKAKKRLTALTQTHSGLALAELDLELRGAGEVFGTKQHGEGELKIANYADIDLIKNTKELAQKIVKNQKNYKNLLEFIRKKQQAAN